MGMGKRARQFAYAFGIFTALLLAALGVMSTPWFRHLLQRRAIRGLEQLSGGHVEIGEFHFKPALLEITFRRLVLHGEEAPGDLPLFSAQTVVVRLNPATFLQRRLLLRSLAWDEAELHIRVGPDGSSNLPGPQIPFRPGEVLNEFMDLDIHRLNLTRTRVFWNNQVLPLELAAGQVGILLRASLRHRYSGSIVSAGTRFQVKGWFLPPVDLKTQFEFTRKELLVPLLTLEAPGFQGKGSLNLRDFFSPRGYLSYQASGEISELAQALRLSELRGGNAHTEGQAIYQQGKFTVEGRLQARRLLFEPSAISPGRVDLSLDYQADRRHVEVNNLKASTLGGTILGRGEVLLTEPLPVFNLRAQLLAPDVATVLRSLAGPRTAWAQLRVATSLEGTAEATWRGRLENFKSQFHLRLHPARAGSSGALPLQGSINGSASNAQGFRVEVQKADLRTPHSALTFQGTALGPPARLAIGLSTTDFEEWRPAVEFLCERTEPIPLVLRSPATFSGTASGSMSHPAMRGQFKLGTFEYSGWTWDGFEAEVAASPTHVELSSGRLWHESSALTLEAAATLADWKLLSSAPVRFSAQAQQTSLGGLEAALGIHVPFRGLTSGRLDLAGTASQLAGAGALQVERGALFQEPFDTFSAKIRVADSIWNLSEIQVAKGAGRLTGQARIDPPHRVFSTELQGTGFLLSQFERLGLCKSRPCPLEGQASFNLRGQGTPENPQLHSTWSVGEIRVNGNPAGSLGGQLDWQGHEMRLQGEGQGPALGALRFSGSAQTEADWPLELHGQFSKLRADPWIHALMGTKFDALVSSSGTFEVAGPLAAPAQAEVRAQISDLEVRSPSLVWKNDQPVNCHLENSVLTAQRFRMRGPSTDLEVEGSMHFAEPPSVSFLATGQAEATLLSLLDPDIHAVGSSQVELRGSGNPAHPLLNGTLTVKDVSLTFGDLPFRLASLNGEIRLEGERATLSSLRGVSGGGAVNLAGFVTLSETPRFDVRLDLDQVRVPYPADFTSVLSGRLRLEGSSERGQLGGELNLRQMYVSENLNLLARLMQPAGSFAAPPGGVSSPLASRIRLKVQVTSTPAVRIETRDLRFAADVDQHLQGTLANPVQVGTIHLLSGEAVFRGNRYRLSRGEVSMSNPFRTQPVLDMEVQTRVQRYDLTLDISGPFDRLRFAYRSDPPLPTEDVLSLLALGYSRQQSEMSTAVGHATPTFGASTLLSEALASQVTGRIQRLFGVSRIKIDPNVGGPGNLSGARVTVEQQVTRDLTLTYVTNTAASQYRIIQFDYAVNENVSLIGVRDQNGIFGLELKFRTRFR